MLRKNMGQEGDRERKLGKNGREKGLANIAFKQQDKKKKT